MQAQIPRSRRAWTLEYVGNCGISFCAPLLGDAKEDVEIRWAWYPGGGEMPAWADFGEYLDALEQNGATLNIATQVGHGTVKRAVMGMDSSAPDIGQLKRMQSLVAESLDAGAMGFSTGLSMAPGSYSLSSEVYFLVEPVAERDKLYSSHSRDSGSEGCGLFVATEELIEAGRRTGLPFAVFPPQGERELPRPGKRTAGPHRRSQEQRNRHCGRPVPVRRREWPHERERVPPLGPGRRSPKRP